MPLDIGIGIFAAIIVSKLFGVELSPLFISAGVVLANLPDLDGVWTFLRNGNDFKAVSKHRELIHYPLIYLPVGALAALPFGPEWSVLFLMASVGHFLHDSIGIGWGIPWLWPFTNKNYSFIYKYAPRWHTEHPRKLLYAWDRNRMDELVERYGDPHWFRNIYLRLHPFFVAELLFFAIALIALWYVKV
mgnify:CR=1 FL=1